VGDEVVAHISDFQAIAIRTASGERRAQGPELSLSPLLRQRSFVRSIYFKGYSFAAQADFC
jgi:hypothetical protein